MTLYVLTNKWYAFIEITLYTKTIHKCSTRYLTRHDPLDYICSQTCHMTEALQCIKLFVFLEITLEWKGVQSKIIQSNILANNGIIHIIDRILFKVEEEEESTLPPNPMNTRGVNGANTDFSVLVSYLTVLTTFYISRLLSRWSYYSGVLMKTNLNRSDPPETLSISVWIWLVTKMEIKHCV